MQQTLLVTSIFNSKSHESLIHQKDQSSYQIYLIKKLDNKCKSWGRTQSSPHFQATVSIRSCNLVTVKNINLATIWNYFVFVFRTTVK